MEDKSQYLALMSEIIGKQSVILGPDIALLKARNVQGLTIDAKGVLTDLEGDPGLVLKALVDEYVDLSGQIVKIALGSVFQKYPSIKHDL